MGLSLMARSLPGLWETDAENLHPSLKSTSEDTAHSRHQDHLPGGVLTHVVRGKVRKKVSGPTVRAMLWRPPPLTG